MTPKRCTYETLKAICEAVSIPVIAIGGITKDNVKELAGSGICGIAVISAIYGQKDIKKASEELKTATKEMVRRVNSVHPAARRGHHFGPLNKTFTEKEKSK